MTGGYIPGVSWLHGLPAGPKIVFLGGVTTLTFYLQSLFFSITIFLAACLAYISIGVMPWRRLNSFGALWSVFLIIAAFQVITSGPYYAFFTLSQMIAILLCADLITGTTPTLSMIDAFLRFLRPLEKIGFPLRSFSLALMLVLRFVPAQLNDWARRHEAWRARGGNRGSWILIPNWIADVLKYSDRVAEALDARGFNDLGDQKYGKS